MKYFRLILMIKEGRLVFSDITEHFMEPEVYESGSWDKPITKVVTGKQDFHFIAFHRDYLEAMLAGIALVKELYLSGLETI